MQGSARNITETGGTRILLVFACVLIILPLLIFRYFPNQDGPAHINSALTLARMDKGSEFLSSYFLTAPFVLTNWATTAILSLLQYIVEPARLEPAFVTLYAVFMIASLLLTMRYLFRVPASYALIFFPLIFSHMLHMGSFNLTLACVLFLPLLGLCHQYLLHPRAWLAGLVGLMLLVIYTLHVQIALLGLGCVGIYISWILAFALFGHTRLLRNASADFRIADGIKLILACLPLLVMCVFFYLYMQNHGALTSRPHYVGLEMKGVHLIFLSGIASYSIFGMGISAFFFAGIVASACFALRDMSCPFRLTSADCMLACGVFILAIFFIIPDGLGDAFNIEERLMIPMLMALLGWLVLRFASHVSTRTVALIAIIFILLQTTDRILAFAQINRDLNEYAEVIAHIPENSAVIAVNLDHVAELPLHRNLRHPFEAMTRFDPERHFMGTALKDRNVALISNYEAMAVRPYFALKYQDWLAKIVGDLDFDVIATNEAENSSFSRLIGNLKNTPAPIAYLAIWSLDPASVSNTKADAFLKAVYLNYDVVFKSSKAHMTLYQMKRNSFH